LQYQYLYQRLPSHGSLPSVPQMDVEEITQRTCLQREHPL
jgi:hypothetical protein